MKYINSLFVKMSGVIPLMYWVAVSFTLAMALLPQPPSIPLGSSDKVQHMLAFAVLSFLACFTFPQRRSTELFLALAILGGLIEILQMIPALHRDADVMDWVADCAASLVVFGLVAALKRLRWKFATA